MKNILQALSVFFVLLIVVPAHAQATLDRAVHLVVPFASGGATDAIGRIIGKRIGEVVGQPVIVENRPGAGGTIGIDYVARAAGNSNTIVLVNALQHTSSAKLYPDLKYDAIKSFRALASIGTLRYILVVNPGFAANDYATFIRTVRSQPGKFAYSSAGVGSAPHLAMELFARSEGLQMLHVPYNGSGPAMNDLVANTVQVSMDNVAAIPLIRAGRLRALAISGERRSEGFPNLPTFAEAGAANFNVLGVWGFLGPAAMTDAAATAIGDGIMAALRDKAIADTLTAQGITPEYGPANQFSQILRDEAERWSKLIEQAKIKL